MKEDLTQQLYKLYTAEVYSVLADDCPSYQKTLRSAGSSWNDKGNLVLTQPNRFKDEMRLQADLAARYIRDENSMEPATMKVKNLQGPLKLFRGESSSGKSSLRSWWFSETVVTHCRKEAGSNPKDQLNWLRNALAVCFNWSNFDKLVFIYLKRGETIPAVTGRALAMPYYRIEPYIDRKTGEHLIKAYPKDYWEKLGHIFSGGERQTLLPWVPTRRAKRIDSL